MTEHRTCRQPDHDEPRIVCGYPLPCPWHTVTIRADRNPPTVEIPVTSDAMLSPMRERLGVVARDIQRRKPARKKG